jgi:hypothetical protein
MTRDEWLTGAVVIAFATLVTAHVTLLAGLAFRPPRWRALAAALAPPLAPVWGARTGMAGRAGVWVASAVAYGVLRWLARR